MVRDRVAECQRDELPGESRILHMRQRRGVQPAVLDARCRRHPLDQLGKDFRIGPASDGRIKPDFTHAWFQIGSAHFGQKKYKEAAAAYKKYAEFSPEDPSGWLSIGVCFMQLKDHESALDPLKKCVELKPDNAVAWYNLAIVYINLKDNYSAKEVYNRLVNLDPSLAERLKKYLR
jgi:tetratricopeptide (TPR) repeat protein